MSRLEALTDAVFALALTLIVVTLEVPRTSAELFEAFRQAPVFLACFAILYWTWVCHYRFHRRYGMEDPLTIFLNAVLLFIVLLYVVPLKFLFALLWGKVLGRGVAVTDSAGAAVADASGAPLLAIARNEVGMVLYGVGYAAIFLLYAAMTANALRRRALLELDARELLLTRASVREHLVQAGFGILSVALALAGSPGAGGFVYFGIGPALTLHGRAVRKAVERLRASVSDR